eukprot:scaffold1504_cov417-Prasinococcus_capsulatus_cf.AAC.18
MEREPRTKDRMSSSTRSGAPRSRSADLLLAFGPALCTALLLPPPLPSGRPGLRVLPTGTTLHTHTAIPRRVRGVRAHAPLVATPDTHMRHAALATC